MNESAVIGELSQMIWPERAGIPLISADYCFPARVYTQNKDVNSLWGLLVTIDSVQSPRTYT